MAALRNFAITLCVSLIIFGLIAYFLVGIAENNLDFLTGADTGDNPSKRVPIPTKISSPVSR